MTEQTDSTTWPWPRSAPPFGWDRLYPAVSPAVLVDTVRRGAQTRGWSFRLDGQDPPALARWSWAKLKTRTVKTADFHGDLQSWSGSADQSGGSHPDVREILGVIAKEVLAERQR